MINPIKMGLIMYLTEQYNRTLKLRPKKNEIINEENSISEPTLNLATLLKRWATKKTNKSTNLIPYSLLLFI